MSASKTRNGIQNRKKSKSLNLIWSWAGLGKTIVIEVSGGGHFLPFLSSQHTLFSSYDKILILVPANILTLCNVPLPLSSVWRIASVFNILVNGTVWLSVIIDP